MLVGLRTEAHRLTTPLPFLVFPMYIIKFCYIFLTGVVLVPSHTSEKQMQDVSLINSSRLVE